MPYTNCCAAGLALAPADCCKTPPLGIPVTYTNLARRSEAIPNVPHILYCGGPVHNMATVIPVTHGDEGGAMGGVASGSVAARSIEVTGSSAVIVCGAPETRLNDTNLPNNQNTSGQTVEPSQYKCQTCR